MAGCDELGTGGDERVRQDVEPETELEVELVLPLLGEAAGALIGEADQHASLRVAFADDAMAQRLGGPMLCHEPRIARGELREGAADEAGVRSAVGLEVIEHERHVIVDDRGLRPGGMFADWGGARVAGLYRKEDGQLRNTFLNRDEEALEQKAARLKFRLFPFDSVTSDLMFQASDTSAPFWPYQLFKLDDDTRGASELAKNLFGGAAADFVELGLQIAGWVAMWRPLEMYLYDWWPIRAEAQLSDRLATMPVRMPLRAA